MTEENINATYTFNLSKLAGEKIKDQLIKRGTPNSSLRLGVKGGGCSGYSYVIKFEDQPAGEKDLSFVIDGVTLLIDKKSIAYLNGSTLDFEQSLLKQGFKFVNPNEKSRCGCSESFSV